MLEYLVGNDQLAYLSVLFSGDASLSSPVLDPSDAKGTGAISASGAAEEPAASTPPADRRAARARPAAPATRTTPTLHSCDVLAALVAPVARYTKAAPPIAPGGPPPAGIASGKTDETPVPGVPSRGRELLRIPAASQLTTQALTASVPPRPSPGKRPEGEGEAARAPLDQAPVLEAVPVMPANVPMPSVLEYAPTAGTSDSAPRPTPPAGEPAVHQVPEEPAGTHLPEASAAACGGTSPAPPAPGWEPERRTEALVPQTISVAKQPVSEPTGAPPEADPAPMPGIARQPPADAKEPRLQVAWAPLPQPGSDEAAVVLPTFPIQRRQSESKIAPPSARMVPGLAPLPAAPVPMTEPPPKTQSCTPRAAQVRQEPHQAAGVPAPASSAVTARPAVRQAFADPSPFPRPQPLDQPRTATATPIPTAVTVQPAVPRATQDGSRTQRPQRLEWPQPPVAHAASGGAPPAAPVAPAGLLPETLPALPPPRSAHPDELAELPDVPSRTAGETPSTRVPDVDRPVVPPLRPASEEGVRQPPAVTCGPADGPAPPLASAGILPPAAGEPSAVWVLSTSRSGDDNDGRSAPVAFTAQLSPAPAPPQTEGNGSGPAPPDIRPRTAPVAASGSPQDTVVVPVKATVGSASSRPENETRPATAPRAKAAAEGADRPQDPTLPPGTEPLSSGLARAGVPLSGESHAASAPGRPTEPPAAAAAPRDERPPDGPPPHPAPAARNIQLQVNSGEQRVDVQVVERGGEVHVAVRTPDARLTGELRDDLPALAARLEQTGLRAETWQPPPATGSAERPRLAEASTTASSPDSGGQSRQDGRQSQQDSQQPPDSSSQNSNRKSDRKEFAWLFTSQR